MDIAQQLLVQGRDRRAETHTNQDKREGLRERERGEGGVERESYKRMHARNNPLPASTTHHKSKQHANYLITFITRPLHNHPLWHLFVHSWRSKPDNRSTNVETTQCVFLTPTPKCVTQPPFQIRLFTHVAQNQTQYHQTKGKRFTTHSKQQIWTFPMPLFNSTKL